MLHWLLLRRSILFLSAHVREVDAQLSAHDFVAVEIPNCRGSGVDVHVFSETVTFRPAGISVVNQTELAGLADCIEYMGYLKLI